MTRLSDLLLQRGLELSKALVDAAYWFKKNLVKTAIKKRVVILEVILS